jgi:light-regulated signal transduction histidine kinase (bacteriophytochrome)
LQWLSDGGFWQYSYLFKDAKMEDVNCNKVMDEALASMKNPINDIEANIKLNSDFPAAKGDKGQLAMLFKEWPPYPLSI